MRKESEELKIKGEENLEKMQREIAELAARKASTQPDETSESHTVEYCSKVQTTVASSSWESELYALDGPHRGGRPPRRHSH